MMLPTLIGPWATDPNAGAPIMATAEAVAASTPATRIFICTCFSSSSMRSEFCLP